MSRSSGASNYDYFIVFLIVFAGYVLTCAPGALWQDSGMFHYRISQQDLEGKMGLALAHPLYILIGIAAKYVPIGEFETALI
jgi:hypothetical protein